MENLYKIFVYGSLRQGFGHPAFQYIGDYFHFIGPGKVRGLLYDLGEYPAAVPTGGEHYIVGELYAAEKADEFSYAIAQLDDYEGLDPEEGPPLYRREQVTVSTDAGDTTAWIYWYNGYVGQKPVVASGDILEYMKAKG